VIFENLYSWKLLQQHTALIVIAHTPCILQYHSQQHRPRGPRCWRVIVWYRGSQCNTQTWRLFAD